MKVPLSELGPLTASTLFDLRNFFIPNLKQRWVRALGLGMCGPLPKTLNIRIDTLFMTTTLDSPYKGFPSPGR